MSIKKFPELLLEIFIDIIVDIIYKVIIGIVLYGLGRLVLLTLTSGKYPPSLEQKHSTWFVESVGFGVTVAICLLGIYIFELL